MSIDKKDMCDDVHDKYLKEDELITEDICDEIYAEDIEKDEFYDKFSEDNHKNTEDYSHLEESNISVNCKLKVNFDTKNKMIYLYPRKSQYFTVNVSKACGDVTIRYKGNYPNNGICGNLGIYRIVPSGIVVQTYCKLDPVKKDILNFIAIDECTKEYCDFVVVFSSNSCGYYY